MAQTVRCLSTMWENCVRSLGQEDPLEKEMATHTSTIAWKIPWTEEPGRLQSMGSQSQTRLSDFTFTFTDLGSSSFSVIIFLPFHTVHGVLKARILKWFAIPFSSGPRFVRTHHDSFVLGGPTQHGS